MAACVRRGEIWRYQVPGLAARTVVLIAAQIVLDRPEYTVLPALQVTDTDPGHLLYVSTQIDGHTVWIDAAGGWLAIRRSLLAECLATLPGPDLGDLDSRITAALGGGGD